MISTDFFRFSGGLVTTKLLAVDDSKTIRRVLEITFAGEDFQTELAGSADEALQKLRADRPAIALVDAALAEASGYDLCQQIKAEAPDVSVIILSSKHRPYDQGRGAAVGASDHMDKPFDTQKLIDKVQAVLAAAPVQAPAARPPAPPPVAAAPAPAPEPVAPAPSAPSPARKAPAPAPAVSQARRAPAQPEAPRTPVAAAAAAATGDMAAQLAGMGLDEQQLQGVLALSREVVEKVVWEVVPVLAETLIKEEIARLTSD